ncbi:magnesium transporter NIPA-domain-containing protein, partial [Flagelloscypha sp. PMI_526]
MSSTSATATSSASAATTSKAASVSFGGGNLKIVGIILAICSGVLIGSSFVLKKKGLLRSQAGQVAGEGVAYLKSALWWTGMIMMILGELCNFAAYAFVEAIVVTPLGALSVVISAILSSFFLKEKLSLFGWMGCALTILGSVIIALNGPHEETVGQITEFQKLFISPGFLAYAGVLIVSSVVIVVFVAPKYGKKTMLWYIMVCSMIGGISVSVTTGLGAAIVTTASGDNQFKHWFIYFLAGFVIITLLVEIYYLNVALALFNTGLSHHCSSFTPTYYVIFTFFSMVTTIVLYKGLSASAAQIITIVMAFLVICVGITVLQMSKVDPTHLKKLDRRSTILLQAAREHTETLDEKNLAGIEDPGMDALRGSFGTVGSIIRARSAKRMSMNSNAGWRSRTLPPGAAHPYNPHGVSWVSNRFTGSPPPSTGGDDHLSGMQRHQLYDAPMPKSPGSDIDAYSMKSGVSGVGKKPTIKFGSQDVVHQYQPTKAGAAAATHEHRATLTPNPVDEHGAYPPLPPVPRSAISDAGGNQAPLVDLGSPPRDDISVGTTLSIPTHLRGQDEAQSAPPTLFDKPFSRAVPGRMDSRDIFTAEGGKSKAKPPTDSLHSFPSVTDSARSLAWDDEADGGDSKTRGIRDSDAVSTGSGRGRGKDRKYPRGNGEDDREESVSLWQRSGSGSTEDESTVRGGGVRLV